MLEDYLAQQPTAIWNSVRGVWEKPGMANLLCAHLELYSETWQTSGMMRDGQVFALPTLERPTNGSESLLLRTPSVTDSTGGAISEEQARERGRMVKTADQVAQLAFENGLKVSPSIADSLLPTPNTMDHLPARTPEQKAANKGKGGYSNVRETVVNDLLPTPQVDDSKNTGHNQTRRETLAQTAWLLPTPVASEGTKAPAQQTSEQKSQTGQVWLSNAAKDMEISWGKFEPAIRRWEQTLNRKAPPPTKPDGKDGAHRLSSHFTEWMMGLPDGWITNCGLTRNEELKACGNGVVPQQAELALKQLLQGIEL